ncbi:MBL fold metallo-hydrolase, partial [Candidatus Woesearchaeota archaeon]|nr:MBL fold metallo-hydrolase [Candidatus Woesearchaeota archaeon]
MSAIVDTIKENIPKDARISEISYEGSEIIIYTKNAEFFRTSTSLIKSIVSKIKKRIEVRADPSIITPEEEAKEFIKKVVPEEAGIKDIYFEPEFARVVIHAVKPGIVIGKNGETLLAIKETTLWMPDIKRAPVIDSEIIRSIRRMLHKEAGYRKKFLNSLGEKIYSSGKEVEWIRVTALGAFREIGRSCVFLQTPQSKVLLDCGMSVAATASKPHPYLDVPEFRIQDLDAVVLSHAHTDHCLPPETPVYMGDGTVKSISSVQEGDEILSINFETGKQEKGICAGKTTTKNHKTTRLVKTPFRTIEASPNHRFFTVRNLDIMEIETQDLEKGDLLPSTSVRIEYNSSQRLQNSVDYKGRAKETILPTELTENLAALVGYMQGDGHYSSGTTIRITDADQELLEFYKNLVYQIFRYNALIRHHTDKSKNAWVLEINNAKIIRFLEANFPKFLTKTKERKVPENILNSGRNIKSPYVRGLMDADGSVTKAIKFTSYSPELLHGTRSILTELGVRCHHDVRFKSLACTSLQGIRNYRENVGFNSSKKIRKLQSLARISHYEKDIVPITSQDVTAIMKAAGILGRVHGSPKIRDDLSLYDLHHRGKGYCTRKTAERLLKVLEARVQELGQIRENLPGNLKNARQNLSLTLSDISTEIGVQRHVVEYRERFGYADAVSDVLYGLVAGKIQSAINSANFFTDKIVKILDLDVLWEPIITVEVRQNIFEELVDIEVLPHRNFIANGIVVHNSGMVPFLYEWGYRGPLYCTRPTRDLSALLQLDYLQICQRENKKAMYSSKGIEEAIKHCVTLEYDEVSDIAPDMRLTLSNAGHMLGSSVCHLHIGDGLFNLLYSLDWTVPVPVISPDGELLMEPIGKLVDAQLKDGMTISDGFVEKVENAKGWKTVAFNPKTLKAEVVPITSFIRHPITEKLYRIRASGGKEVVVTASHNVFQVIDGEIRAVETKDLQPGQ